MLSENPLFSGFAEDELEEILRRSQVSSYAPGERVIRAGEAGLFLGIALDGALRAEARQPDGEREMLGEIAAGDYFGEISLVSGGPTMADVVAATRCEVLQIPHRVMSDALSRHPHAFRHMARTITERLTRAPGPPAPPQAKAEPPAEREAEASELLARILVVHCEGERLRYHYYDTDNAMNDVRGLVVGIGSGRAQHTSSVMRSEKTVPVGKTLADAAQSVLQRLTAGAPAALSDLAHLTAVAHRVAHGAEAYSRAVVVDDAVLEDIRSRATPACPGTEANAAGIEAFRCLLPDIPQVAAFDTAFFAAIPPRAFMYAVPHAWYERHGVRRYGRGGLVHQQAALLAAAHLRQPLDGLSLITCCLGLSSSVCAIRGGHALDVSGGFTALAGLPGSTSSGDTDPGLAPHVAGLSGRDPQDVHHSLSAESGLLGLSGLSGDLVELIGAAGAGNERAELALDVFCYQLRKHFGAYWALLGDLDAVVFAGPAGTAAPELRARVCAGLRTLGVELDDDLNQSPSPDTRGVSDVSFPGSATRILVVPTDESRMIAAATAEAVGHGAVSAAILARRRPIPVGISAHHVHLSQEHVEALFGPGHELTFRAPLSQPGQFACEEMVALVSEKGRVERVRVLGPERDETQVEVSRTECFALGVQAPIRMSGDLDGTPGILLEGPQGTVELEEGTICARRHLHASPEEALMLGLRNQDEISIRIAGERSLVFSDIAVRVHPEYRLDVHVDTDEANAAQLGRGAVGYIESVDVRV
jgi:acetate kinase